MPVHRIPAEASPPSRLVFSLSRDCTNCRLNVSIWTSFCISGRMLTNLDSVLTHRPLDFAVSPTVRALIISCIHPTFRSHGYSCSGSYPLHNSHVRASQVPRLQTTVASSCFSNHVAASSPKQTSSNLLVCGPVIDNGRRTNPTGHRDDMRPTQLYCDLYQGNKH